MNYEFRKPAHEKKLLIDRNLQVFSADSKPSEQGCKFRMMKQKDSFHRIKISFSVTALTRRKMYKLSFLFFLCQMSFIAFFNIGVSSS